jgi:hypothetical protein
MWPGNEKRREQSLSAFWRLVLGPVVPQNNKKLPERNSLHDTSKNVAPSLTNELRVFQVGSGLAATSSAHQNSAASSIPTPAEPHKVATSQFTF